jgi:4-alpha-glucanotransferase
VGEGTALRALAERAGILSEYTAIGGERRVTSEATRRALLAALGYDAGDETRAAAALAGLPPARGRERTAPGAPRCTSPEERTGGRRVFGLWANLYSLRGRRGLGVGNLSDLRELVRFAGEAGADFVGVSPLHALRNRPPEISPYQPLSRLFRNPLYLDATAFPEWEESGDAKRLLEAGPAARELAALLGARRIDYARSAALQRRLLDLLHRAFRARQRSSDSPRAREFARFRREGGELLEDFATFCALEEQLAEQGHPRDWRAWPAELRSPRSEAVRRFREQHPAEVELHAFLQFELDRQLGRVAREASEAGLAIGLYQDLALGSAASGFDPWAFPDLFLAGASVGAPPDDYAAQGQVWELPPQHPARLVAGEQRYWRCLLRAGFAHAGALRIDHVLGLFRQFWIPVGEPASQGAYVRFPAVPLLAALAEESRRARALVVGEDLGTVPRGLPSLLARFGVLSTRVLLFERDRRGRFHPARRYSRRALVTAETHDHPPLAGYLRGRDLELRRLLGILPDNRRLAEARSAREAERQALLRRLASDGDLPAAGAPPAFPELCAAVHRFLCRTPAPLVGLSVDDLAGEEEPVNLPGVPPAAFPSWTRRMELELDALPGDPGVRAALSGARERARPVREPGPALRASPPGRGPS